MGLPFTPDQFFDIFAEYNRAFWFVVVVLWLVGAGLVAATWRSPAGFSRSFTYFLGVLWAWGAVAYHLFLFTRINPAAWLFGALFAVQAALLFWSGARRRLEDFSSSGLMPALGAGLTLYAFAYPVLSSALGHAYPATPTFGVPCPTAILTIGTLLTLRGGVPKVLAIVPLLWAFIGGSAALLLEVATDYALLAAGALLTIVLVARWDPRRARHERRLVR